LRRDSGLRAWATRILPKSTASQALCCSPQCALNEKRRREKEAGSVIIEYRAIEILLMNIYETIEFTKLNRNQQWLSKVTYLV